MKKTLLWFIVLVVSLSMFSVFVFGGCKEEEAAEEEVVEEEVVEEEVAEEEEASSLATETSADIPVKGKKVAYVMVLPSSTIFQMWVESEQKLCDSLDVEYDYFFCDGDFNKWQDTIRTCASAGYDGIVASHGSQDGSYVFLKEITEQYPDMKIVTFDIQFYADGEYQKIPGVTQVFQQDKQLLTVLLDVMIEKFGEGVRLIKVWRGPNYISPFDRREVGWQEYETAGKIVKAGEIQPLQDTVDSANTVSAAYLQSVNREDVDGLITYYDAYGQGVYNSISENNSFNGTDGDALPMASVDIDPVDITNMQTRPDIWVAAGTTDWTMNGEVLMRILLLEIADQYDKIYDPASQKSGVDWVEIPGAAIKAEDLKPDSTIENLGDIAGEEFGSLDYLSEADWMPKDLIH